MKGVLVFLSCILWLTMKAQDAHPHDTIPIRIISTPGGDVDHTINFKAEARELRPIAGAPAPFYTYFWEFGDGTFSFMKEPAHRFKDTGVYQVRVYATNNYDDGKPPPIRPKPMRIEQSGASALMADAKTSSVFGENENLTLKVNAMPKPDEEMVLIIGYRNDEMAGANRLGGRIVLFQNEVDFKQNNFALKDVRTYHNEQDLNELGELQFATASIDIQDDKQRGGYTNTRTIPIETDQALAAMKQRQAFYREKKYWSFDNLEQGEERFIFVSLVTTPEMIRDTNAVITLSAAFIPDDPAVQMEIADLELQIVASHDPNKMMLRHRMMSYRFIGKNRKLNYKVRFQNTGEGPAKRVLITVNLPEIVDPNELEIKEMSPRVVFCDDAYSGQSCLDTLIYKDSIQFIFKNIYLPGVQQDGVNDIDSTKGYVAYQLGFKERPRKLPFSSRASIVFDKNDPIRTNYSKGWFRPGISTGVIAMYGMQLGKNGQSSARDQNFDLGFSISPVSPYRKYLQAELFLGGHNLFVGPTFRDQDVALEIDGEKVIARSMDSSTTKRVYNLNIVPAQLRFNLNRFIGVGFGPMVGVDLYTKINSRARYVLGDIGAERVIERNNYHKKSFNHINASAFADVQFGLVRMGPAAGVRFIRSFTDQENRLAFYLTWRL